MNGTLFITGAGRPGRDPSAGPLEALIGGGTLRNMPCPHPAPPGGLR